MKQASLQETARKESKDDEEILTEEEEEENKDEGEEVEFVDKVGLDFDAFEPSTMTAFFPNQAGSLKLAPLFYLIPWNKFDCKLPLNHRSSRIKMPDNIPKGHIIGLRYKGECRGLQRIVMKSKTSFFQNAITLDIGTGTKGVCVKLNTKSVHICGAKSEAMCKVAADAILSIVDKITKFMGAYDKKRGDIEKFMEAARGKPCTLRTKLRKGGTCLILSSKDFELKGEKEMEVKEIDPEVVELFSPLLKDYSVHSQFAKLIEALDKNHCIASEDFAVSPSLNVAMVNYNYRLPFKVNRKALDQLIHDRYGFHSRYNNSQENAVYVELPYEKKSLRGKNLHTFMVRRSGAVTQSGPGIALMREAFLLFAMALSEIKEDIEDA